MLGRDQWKVVLVLAAIAVRVGVITMLPLTLQGSVDAVFDKNIARFVWLALAGLGLTFVWTLMVRRQAVLANAVGQGMLERLQLRVFDHLQRLHLGYHTERKSGEIHGKLIDNFTVTRQQFLEGVTGWLYGVAAAVGGVIVLYLLDWRLIVAVILLAVPTVLTSVISGKKHARIAEALRDATKEQSTLAAESISPRILIVNKTIGHEMHRKGFRQQTKLIARLATRLEVRSETALTPVEFAGASLLAAVIIFAGFSVARGEPILSPGGIMAFSWAQSGILYNLQQAARHQLRLSGVLGRFDEAFEVLRTPVLIKPGNRSLPRKTPGRLTFHSVTHRYDNGAAPALDNVSFEVPAGKHVAIVGPSGAGKSTLTACAVRLLDPTAGWVSIDGVDVRELDEESLRRTVGLVSQDPALSRRTVLANILWGRSASYDEVVKAAKLAHIHDHIMDLPDGYKAPVGTDGGKFSGGQVQRIHIARTALGEPPQILFLDEATSSLDPDTQVEVDKALRALQQGRTTVTIAHRLSTVRNADWIFVFDQGRLVEWGTHSSLMRRGGLYREQVVRNLGAG